jgi:pyruvate/2-oxoglutarate dehydrogenase complex dihydrolipoamide dehydrogenase (E3) component
MQKRVPDIKGLDKTKYVELGEEGTSKSRGSILIIGNGELAVSAAIKFALDNRSVTIAYSSEALLDDYDVSVQDVVARYLRKKKVKLAPSHQPLASITKASKTYLLVKSGKTSKKLVSDNLMFEPAENVMNDVGLTNYGSFEADFDDPIIIEHRLVLISGDRHISNLSDAQTYARMLQGKRTRRPLHAIDNRLDTAGVELFSFGVLEQNFMNTHIGYKKSIAKVPIKTSDITGFIKIIVSLRGRIVGASGVVESGNSEDVNLLRSAVKNQTKIKDLMKLIDVNDPLVDAYLEIYRETA